MSRRFYPLASLLYTATLLVAVWLLLPGSSRANSDAGTVRYVAPGGDCGGRTPCYAAVQAAVDASNPGDQILVAAGRYTGVTARSGGAQVVYLDKAITLKGGFHPQTWQRDVAQNASILDAEEQGRVLTIVGDEAAVVDGFRLTRGSAGNGGGVYVESAGPTLSGNHIYANWAEGHGGGLYLKDSAAQLHSNHIYTNTTGPSGRGGGLALIDSPATVTDNVIEDNRAHVGGGVLINSTLSAGGALLEANAIRNNAAFDLEQDGRTFDGAGGGVDLSSYLTDTLRSNIISGNTAKWGGGVHAFGAWALVTGNTLQENYASYHGGGFYIQGGSVEVVGNQVLSNTADSWGGGVALISAHAPVNGNTFRGNVSGWRGGGLYSASTVDLDGNLFLDNTAAEQGGGVFVAQGGGVHANSVFLGNEAKEGGALYLWAPAITLTHATIAGNPSDDGRAVAIDVYPGLVAPEQPTQSTANVVVSNTIVADEATGFFATPGNRLTIDGVLWWNTAVHVETSGATLTVQDEHTGDPRFQADGYHLSAHSAARDRGKGELDHDVDGHLRDAGDAKDLGADEFVPAAVVEPESGMELTYVDAHQDVTITVSVPTDAISMAIGLMFSPFPPLPEGALDGPLGKFVAVGPPFRLDPFGLDATVPVTDVHDPPLGDPEEPFIFGIPAHIVMRLGVEKARQYRESMDRLELQLMAILDGERTAPPRNAACGQVQVDKEKGEIDVPICDTGILSPTALTGAGLGASPPQAGYFVFVLPAKEEVKVYVPFVIR